jgi:hypothetical protein
MDSTIGRDEGNLVELTSVYHEVEANIIRSLLELAGIDCVMLAQVPHAVYPFTVDGLGETKIKVWDHQLEAAREILREHRLHPAADSEVDAF